MKPKILSITLLVALAVGCSSVGCKTPAPANNPAVVNTANDITNVLPMEVATVIQRDPASQPFFMRTADAFDAVASGLNITEVAILHAAESPGWTNRWAQDVVMVGPGYIDAYGAQTGWADIAGLQSLLHTTSGAIRYGATHTPNQIAGYNDSNKRRTR